RGIYVDRENLVDIIFAHGFAMSARREKKRGICRRGMRMSGYAYMQDPVAVASASRVAAASLHGVGATPRSNWLFLRLEMDDGHAGWGELTLRGHEGI